MKWLRNKLRKWLSEDDQKAYIGEAVKNTLASGGGSLNSEPTFNFTVYSAVGGKVVEFRRYDRRADRSDTIMYVIGNDQDFGERISKIATMESLKG